MPVGLCTGIPVVESEMQKKKLGYEVANGTTEELRGAALLIDDQRGGDMPRNESPFRWPMCTSPC